MILSRSFLDDWFELLLCISFLQLCSLATAEEGDDDISELLSRNLWFNGDVSVESMCGCSIGNLTTTVFPFWFTIWIGMNDGWGRKKKTLYFFILLLLLRRSEHWLNDFFFVVFRTHKKANSAKIIKLYDSSIILSQLSINSCSNLNEN